MKVCFIANSKTKAAGPLKFLLEFVKDFSNNCVIKYFSDMDRAAINQIDLSEIRQAQFDIIYVFDVEFLARRLASFDEAPLILFFPLVENTMQLGRGFWKPFEDSVNIRVVNFSALMHRRLMMWNVNSFRFQYFPKPNLTSDGRFLDVHRTSNEMMSFDNDALNAMGLGRCVFAPNLPSYNEYIVDGINGVFVDPKLPSSPTLDSKTAQRIGTTASKNLQNNYQIWRADSDSRLRGLMFTNGSIDPTNFREVGAYCWSRADRTAIFSKDRPEDSSACKNLKVSVAVVCKNAGHLLPKTLDTISAQTYSNIELVVIDGASTDNTASILTQYKDRIDICVSEQDQGPYDGMNKAAELATGTYIVFMNAGDFFHLPSSLADAMEAVFGRGAAWELDDRRRGDNDLPEFVINNHLYIPEDGASALRMTKDFEVTWQQLCDGGLAKDWMGGIPCHQSTLTRRDWLAKRKYDLSYAIAADHHFMFTSRSSDARFVHSGGLLAMYTGGGLSAQRASECHRESFKIACLFNDTPAIRDYYSSRFGEEVLDI